MSPAWDKISYKVLERTTLQLFLFRLQLQTSKVDDVAVPIRHPEGRSVNFMQLQPFAVRVRVCLRSKRVLYTL